MEQIPSDLVIIRYAESRTHATDIHHIANTIGCSFSNLMHALTRNFVDYFKSPQTERRVAELLASHHQPLNEILTQIVNDWPKDPNLINRVTRPYQSNTTTISIPDDIRDYIERFKEPQTKKRFAESPPKPSPKPSPTSSTLSQIVADILGKKV